MHATHIYEATNTAPPYQVVERFLCDEHAREVTEGWIRNGVDFRSRPVPVENVSHCDECKAGVRSDA